MVAMADRTETKSGRQSRRPGPLLRTLVKWRLAIQSSFLVLWLMPASLRMHNICAPVYHCYACPLSTFACPIGVIANFSAMHTIPFIAIGTLLVVGGLFGGFICGWVCPFGLLQDLFAKIPTPKITLPHWTGYTRYAVLLGLVILIPYFYGKDHPLFICRVCPAGGIEGALPYYVQDKLGWTDSGDNAQDDAAQTDAPEATTGDETGAASSAEENPFGGTGFDDLLDLPGEEGDTVPAEPPGDEAAAGQSATEESEAGPADGQVIITGPGLVKWSIIGVFLAAMLVKARPWCTLFCPLGAIFGFMNGFSAYYLKIDPVKCRSCGVCKSKLCPYGLDPAKNIDDPRCVRCLKCTSCHALDPSTVFKDGESSE